VAKGIYDVRYTAMLGTIQAMYEAGSGWSIEQRNHIVSG
jgi:hypothetical protein